MFDGHFKKFFLWLIVKEISYLMFSLLSFVIEYRTNGVIFN